MLHDAVDFGYDMCSCCGHAKTQRFNFLGSASVSPNVPLILRPVASAGNSPHLEEASNYPTKHGLFFQIWSGGFYTKSYSSSTFHGFGFLHMV